jgi:hypothetical protein
MNNVQNIQFKPMMGRPNWSKAVSVDERYIMVLEKSEVGAIVSVFRINTTSTNDRVIREAGSTNAAINRALTLSSEYGIQFS